MILGGAGIVAVALAPRYMRVVILQSECGDATHEADVQRVGPDAQRDNVNSRMSRGVGLSGSERDARDVGNPAPGRGEGSQRHDGDADVFFFFSSRRRHTRLQGDWSSDVCSSD